MAKTHKKLSRRDALGRFGKGNPGGPGNPALRVHAAYRRAIVRAVTPALIGRVLSKLAKLAASGDVAAAREVLNRAIGRPAECPQNDAGEIIDLGAMDTPEACQRATGVIAKAIKHGALTSEDALRFAMVVKMAGEAVDRLQLEARLAAVERAIGQPG